MPPPVQRLIEQVQRYEERDPELFEELRRSFPTHVRAAGDVMRPLAAPGPARTASAGATLSSVDRRALETIVHPVGRPVLVVRDNRVTADFVGPQSRVWAKRVRSARSRLNAVIPSIGRIEISHHADCTWAGTGWLVADDVIVTNRHVAREFAAAAADGFRFRSGVNGAPMQSRIDFLEEYGRARSLEFEIERVLWIAAPEDADVAFLRVRASEPGVALPRPIGLAERVAADEQIAAIGYPARDARIPDQDLVRAVFGEVYEKKRLAPGQVLSVSDDELEHDCSTLGGNSGSALISLDTGHAVGLHFAGLFLQANYAVPSTVLRALLRRLERGELVQPVRVRPVKPVVTVSEPRGEGEDALRAALTAARVQLAENPNVLEIRPGWRFRDGWITDERVVVVELREKKPVAELERSGEAPIPAVVQGVGVDVRTASLGTQLEHMGVDLEGVASEAPARAALYREPTHLQLARVRSPMHAIFHTSPDAGFPTLEAFLGRVRRRLTAALYEWDAAHITAAVASAVRHGNDSLRMVTQLAGTRDAVLELQQLLGRRFRHTWASVGPGRLIPRAYHIKVAVRDGEELWLSSGNWKRSGQPPIDPLRDRTRSIEPLRQYNREWHAVLRNPALATLFENYIEHDFREAKRFPAEEAPPAALPEFLVRETLPEAARTRRPRAKYFQPLVLDRELDIQPLLTPDRDARGRPMFLQHVLTAIRSAEQRLYVQNQSLNLLAENHELFEAFFSTLRKKQETGVDVRIIFRDTREFGAGSLRSQQRLLERLKDFGLDMDGIRLQRGCHTKGIIIDGRIVIMGSHNLTNEGSLFNRDASLLVRDPEVASFFEQIFLFDWNALAVQEADERPADIRLARPGQQTPPGYRRVSLAELLGDD